MKTQGYTLIESIIVLTLLAILSAYAIPQWRQFKLNQSLSTELNRLTAVINYARNQSISSSHHVILCPSVSMQGCDNGSLWHQGWMVFEDINFNRNFDVGDRLLLTEGAMDDDITAISADSRKIIRYDQLGAAPGSNLTIRFCDDRGAENGKSVIISNVGRPRVAQHVERCE